MSKTFLFDSENSKFFLFVFFFYTFKKLSFIFLIKMKHQEVRVSVQLHAALIRVSEDKLLVSLTEQSQLLRWIICVMLQFCFCFFSQSIWCFELFCGTVSRVSCQPDFCTYIYTIGLSRITIRLILNCPMMQIQRQALDGLDMCRGMQFPGRRKRRRPQRHGNP